MRRSVLAGGLRWLLGQSLATRLLGVMAYAALGWFLSDSEFGLYAFAFSLATFAQALQDRGVREILISRGLRRFATSWVQVLRHSLKLNLLAAVLLVIAGFGIAGPRPNQYHLTVVFLALAIPVGTPWASASALLSLRGGFGAISRVGIAASTAQYALAVLLAGLGGGAPSLAVGLLVAAVVKGLAGLSVLRDAPRSEETSKENLWPHISWLVVAALGTAGMLQGDYFVAGVLLPASTVGIYYFAYQIPLQIVSVIAPALHGVLLPYLSELHQHAPRRAQGVLLRVSDWLVLVMSLGGTMVVAGAPILEDVIWQNQWDGAVIPMQIISLAMPFRALADIPKTLLTSQGYFKRWAAEAVGLGTFVVIGVAMGSLGNASPIILAIWSAGALATATMPLWYRTYRLYSSRGLALASLFRLVRTYVLANLGAWAIVIAALRGRMQGLSVQYALETGAWMMANLGIVLLLRRGDLNELRSLLMARGSRFDCQ